MAFTEVSGPAGRLEALIEEGTTAGVQAAVVLAHPHPQYGGTMHSKVVYQAAKAFARVGCAVLRFNFRGVGASAGTFDNGVGEASDFRAALEFMRARHPSARLWSAGYSFGAWIALSVGAADPAVSTLVGIATPVGRYELESVRVSTKPKFFIHAERDDICPLKVMQEFYARCEDPRELVVIDAADHLFDGKASEVGDTIEDLFMDWEG